MVDEKMDAPPAVSEDITVLTGLLASGTFVRLFRVPPALLLFRCAKCIGFDGDTVIESQNAIDTTNLVYIVLPGVQVVFRAPAVSLKRGEVMMAVWAQSLDRLIDLLATVYERY